MDTSIWSLNRKYDLDGTFVGSCIDKDDYDPHSPPNHLTSLNFNSDTDSDSDHETGRFSSETSLKLGHFSPGTSLIHHKHLLYLKQDRIKFESSSGIPRRSFNIQDGNVSYECSDGKIVDEDSNSILIAYYIHGKTVNGKKETTYFARSFRRIFGAIRSVDDLNLDYLVDRHNNQLLAFDHLPFSNVGKVRSHFKAQYVRTYFNYEEEIVYRSLDLLNRIIFTTFNANPIIGRSFPEPAPFEKYKYYTITVLMLQLVRHVMDRHDFRHSFDNKEDIPQSEDFYLPLEMTNCLLSISHVLCTLTTETLENLCLALSFDYRAPLNMRHAFGMSPRIIFHEVSINCTFSLKNYRARRFRLFSIAAPNRIQRTYFCCKMDETSILGRIRYSRGFMQMMSDKMRNLPIKYFEENQVNSMGSDTKAFYCNIEYKEALELYLQDPCSILNSWNTATNFTRQDKDFPSHSAPYDDNNTLKYHRKSILRKKCRDIDYRTRELRAIHTDTYFDADTFDHYQKQYTSESSVESEGYREYW